MCMTQTQRVTAEKEKEQQSSACVASGTHVEREETILHPCCSRFTCLGLGFLVSFVSSPKDQVLPSVLIYILFKLALQPLTWRSWRGECEVFKLKGGNISLALHQGFIVESNLQIPESVIYI